MPVENNILELMPNFVKNHWDYNKNEVSPEEVSIFSESHYYWKNESSTSFYFKPSQVHSRLNNTSLPEQTIFYFLQKIFHDTKSRHIFINGIKKYEADIYVPSLDLVIEYDGSYYHKGKEKYNLDIEKNNFFQSKGLFCIRIREKGLQKLPEFYGALLNKENSEDIDMVNVVFETIEKYMLSYKYNNNIKAVSEFKLDEKEYRNALSNIHKLIWLDSEDVESGEALVNFYKLHKNKDLCRDSIVKKFIEMWEICDYTSSYITTFFYKIKEPDFLIKISENKKIVYFDFVLFDNLKYKEWFYNYWLDLINSDSNTIYFFENSVYGNFLLHLQKELKDNEKIWDENILIEKGLNITDDMLKMLKMICIQIINKNPKYYRKWIYERIVNEIDKYLQYKN